MGFECIKAKSKEILSTNDTNVDESIRNNSRNSLILFLGVKHHFPSPKKSSRKVRKGMKLSLETRSLPPRLSENLFSEVFPGTTAPPPFFTPPDGGGPTWCQSPFHGFLTGYTTRSVPCSHNAATKKRCLTPCASKFFVFYCAFSYFRKKNNHERKVWLSCYAKSSASSAPLRDEISKNFLS